LGDSAIEVPDAAMGTVTRAANVQLKKKPFQPGLPGL